MAMASTSSTSSRSCKYHVFLSFRGEDSRTGFTSHLYAALTRKGITTFFDDNNLRKGDVISHELVTAIEESMFAIIVLSPNYASSTWCLDELHNILQCNHKFGQHIEAVFYGVEPSDVRHQKGTFADAFSKHELRFGQESDKVTRWRDALTQIAGYSGWSSKNQNEATLVENISQSIHQKLIPNLPSSMNKLVGIHSRVEQVISHIGMGLNDVRYIGICGMGGIGKTTLARIVYEAIKSKFQVSYFLASVRETCEKNGIVQAQKELVGHINGSPSNFNNEYDGRRIIRASLCHKKVLLVLDDINEEKQLKNLAEEQDWFGPGSRIIITTRDMHLLKIHDAHEIYNVEGLGESEAFDLFRLKAFKQRKPAKEYLDLSKQAVKYSAGLPLALEVLGSHLYGRPIKDWHSALGKLKSFLHVNIFDTLKISYDALDSMDKDIFLDIAYFFKGWSKGDVIEILERCGYHVEIGIATLIDRSLLTINECGNLKMHDLVEEMGKHIVIQESPNDPSKRSRLRGYDDINLVLTHNKGSEATHSIVLEGDKFYKTVRWSNLIFSNICQLKLLILDGVNAPILSYIPRSLRVLRWKCCPMVSLPFMDQYYELVEIDLSSSSRIVQVWHGKKFLEKLKYLDLSFCHLLKQIPDLSEAPNLEILKVQWCQELNDFPSYLTCHKSLVKLNLRHCSSLETLGSKLEMSSLKELDLGGCTRMRKLPEFGECMKHLSVLSLYGTAIEELPATVGCLVGLKELRLYSCKRLTRLPDSIQKLKSLTFLDLSYSPNVLQSLHSLSGLTSLGTLRLWGCFLTSKSRRLSASFNLVNLPSLTDLELSHNNFVRVPINIHELHRLRRLNLDYCPNLKVLPELPSSIRELYATYSESQDSWHSNVISKVCCGFAASANHDSDGVLEMWVAQKQIEEEIPAWFVNQEEGNGVSVTLPHNETIALALYFLLCPTEDGYDRRVPMWVICNGKDIIKKGLTEMRETEHSHHFILCLTSDYFVDQFCQDYRFELIFPSYSEMKVQSSGARWVCKQDIRDLNKSGSETSKRKATFDPNMNISPPSSPSPNRKKMLMVAPSSSVTPLEEEEEEHAAIAEKEFYMYPVGPKAASSVFDPPELLPLFPLHSHDTASS